MTSIRDERSEQPPAEDHPDEAPPDELTDEAEELPDEAPADQPEGESEDTPDEETDGDDSEAVTKHTWD